MTDHRLNAGRTLTPLFLSLVWFACEGSKPNDHTLTDQERNRTDAQIDTPFCEGGVRALYNPLSGARLDSMPDDFYTVEAETETGRVVSFGDPDWLQALPVPYAEIYRDVEGLDGWGLNAGIHLRFDTEIAFGSDPNALGAHVGLYSLEDGEAHAIPFEVRAVSDGQSALFFPLVPLKEHTKHALVVRSDALAPNVECIEASATLQALLRGDVEDPALVPLVGRYRELMDALSLKPADIGAAVVFTTQTVTTTARNAAENASTQVMDWIEQPICDVTSDTYRRCTGSYTGFDYRTADNTFEETPQAEWTMEVDMYLPVGQAPYPIVVYGHGIIDDRLSAQASAEILTPLGIAVIAIDAPHHGRHPTSPPDGADPIDSALGLLGADLDTLELNTDVMRNNFRQAASDKLQLLTLLEQHTDIDGDGASDLDFTRLGYHGVSLGGIMGPEFLSLRDDIDIALLAVPGGRLSTLFADSEIMSLFLVLLQSLVEDKSDTDRLLPVAQTSIDAGDPATWGPHTIRERLDNATPPSVLMVMAYEDETIPISATHALTRALNIPVIAPVVVDPLVVDVVSAPVKANLGAATAGLFQFDRVRQSEDAPPERAKHNTTPFSLEVRYQAAHFFRTWLETGTPEIIDPFMALNTPEK